MSLPHTAGAQDQETTFYGGVILDKPLGQSLNQVQLRRNGVEILKGARIIASRDIGHQDEPFQVLFLKALTASHSLAAFTLHKLPARPLACGTLRDTFHGASHATILAHHRTKKTERKTLPPGIISRAILLQENWAWEYKRKNSMDYVTTLLSLRKCEAA